jgi:hypothetical protein
MRGQPDLVRREDRAYGVCGGLDETRIRRIARDRQPVDAATVGHHVAVAQVDAEEIRVRAGWERGRFQTPMVRLRAALLVGLSYSPGWRNVG